LDAVKDQGMELRSDRQVRGKWRLGAQTVIGGYVDNEG
jgi:hypothetical protein